MNIGTCVFEQVTALTKVQAIIAGCNWLPIICIFLSVYPVSAATWQNKSNQQMSSSYQLAHSIVQWPKKTTKVSEYTRNAVTGE